ncbi:putative lipoprotein [Leptospira wolffii serovar Khorat str. Khorat-H2]|nr:putative lipoprotein [Leptospira wolffii serovar Khorat str. Khorat-H2]
MKLFSILLIFVSLCGCDKKKSIEYDSTAYPENKEKFGISDYFLFLPKEACEKRVRQATDSDYAPPVE